MSRNSHKYDPNLSHEHLASHYLQSTDVRPESIIRSSLQLSDYNSTEGGFPGKKKKTLYDMNKKTLSINPQIDKISKNIFQYVSGLGIDDWMTNDNQMKRQIQAILDDFPIMGVLGFLQMIKDQKQIKSLPRLVGKYVLPKIAHILGEWTVTEQESSRSESKLLVDKETFQIINTIKSHFPIEYLRKQVPKSDVKAVRPKKKETSFLSAHRTLQENPIRQQDRGSDDVSQSDDWSEWDFDEEQHETDSFSDSTGGASVPRIFSKERINEQDLKNILEKYDQTMLPPTTVEKVHKQFDFFISNLKPQPSKQIIENYGREFLAKFEISDDNRDDRFEKIINRKNNILEKNGSSINFDDAFREEIHFAYGKKYRDDKLRDGGKIKEIVSQEIQKPYSSYPPLTPNKPEPKTDKILRFYSDNRKKISKSLSAVDKKFYVHSYNMSINQLNTDGVAILQRYPNIGILIILQALGRLIALHGRTYISHIYLRLNPELLLAISIKLRRTTINMRNSIESKYLDILLKKIREDAQSRFEQQKSLNPKSAKPPTPPKKQKSPKPKPAAQIRVPIKRSIQPGKRQHRTR